MENTAFKTICTTNLIKLETSTQKGVTIYRLTNIKSNKTHTIKGDLAFIDLMLGNDAHLKD